MRIMVSGIRRELMGNEGVEVREEKVERVMLKIIKGGRQRVSSGQSVVCEHRKRGQDE